MQYTKEDMKKEINIIVNNIHKMIQDMQIKDPPPYDPEVLIELMGGEIEYIEDNGQMMHGEARVCPVEPYEDRKFEIKILKEIYPLRQNFTLAHEIGHLFLHYSWGNEEEWINTCTRLQKLADGEDTKEGMWRLYDGKSKVEYEANHFAASFLMPEEDITKEYNELRKQYSYVERLLKLSDIYKVSSPAIEVRLKHLGVVSW